MYIYVIQKYFHIGGNGCRPVACGAFRISRNPQ